MSDLGKAVKITLYGIVCGGGGLELGNWRKENVTMSEFVVSEWKESESRARTEFNTGLSVAQLECFNVLYRVREYFYCFGAVTVQ